MERLPADEYPHEPAAAPWTEQWWFDFVADDVAGWARLAHVPAAGRWTYHAAVVEPGARTIGVVDLEVPAPRTGLQIRTTGLWADHICETPFEHWTIGLEAFGLGVDRPRDLVDDPVGELVPLGYDLEWEARPEDTAAASVGTGHRQSSHVTGELLVGTRAWDLEAHGTRAHTWGAAPFHQPVDDSPAVSGRTPVPWIDADGSPGVLDLVLDRFGTDGTWRRVG